MRFIEGEKEFTNADDSIARVGFNYLGETDTKQAADDSMLITSDIPVGFALSERNSYGNDLSLNALVEGGKYD